MKLYLYGLPYLLCIMILLSKLIAYGTQPNLIQDIQFHAYSQNAEFTIDLPAPITHYFVESKNQNVLIGIPDAQLALKWQHMMNVSQFNSCVKSINGQNKPYAQFTVEVKGGCQIKHWLSHQQITIKFNSVKPGSMLKNISLNFQNVSVKALLHEIAELAHINIITSASVQGNMSIHLEQVSWQQALAIILQSQNLAERQIQGAWYIAPQAEILAQNKLELELQKQQENAQPRQTQYFQLHYTEAKQVISIIQHSIAQDLNLSADPRSNILMAQASPSQLAQIQTLLQKIDIPMRQVLIEARIAVVDQSALQELGVVLRTSPSDSLLQRLPIVSGASINLPIENPAGSIGFRIGYLPNGRSLDLELQALESQGQGEIISSPKLLVSDGQKADIEQGNEIPFQTSTSSGATQIEFKKAVLGLQVIPHITSDDQILLSLQVNDDAISRDASPAGEVPVVATSELKTNVLARDGETIVLGGIHIEEVRHDRRGVPYLDQVPGLGWLFRNTADISRKTELMVFVTPKIIKTGISSRYSLEFSNLKRNDNEKIA
ncbi:MAG: type pilus secretin PilQ [Gammaproteobacteria bacterium]|nr:type pilus secretin PilQ [Gammaproteobacteria bacterium]